MKIDWNNIFIFTMGATIGSLVTYKIVKDKYEKILEDIEFIEEEDEDDPFDGSDEYEEYEAIERARKLNLKEYANLIREQSYGQVEFDFGKEEVDNVEKPYVITPEEFGECDGYGMVSLYYHADGVLTDTDNDPVDYVDDVVGLDAFNHFGEYEDDTVFVRNDRFKTDYEILRTEDNYSDTVNTIPYDPEDE